MSMRTDSQSGSGGAGSKGRSGLMQSAIPTAISSSWKYLRNVGGGASVLGEDGTAPLGAPRIGLSAEDNKRKEQVRVKQASWRLLVAMKASSSHAFPPPM
jgi:hypothetical protein